MRQSRPDSQVNVLNTFEVVHCSLGSSSDNQEALINSARSLARQGHLFGVQGSGFRFQGSGFRVQSPGFRIQGSGSRVQGLENCNPGCRISGFAFEVQGRIHSFHTVEHHPFINLPHAIKIED